MGLRNRLAEQLRKPEGWLGSVMGLMMRRINGDAVHHAVELLAIEPTDRVLEIGFGPGVGIEAALEKVPDGWVCGLDFSVAMLNKAKQRFRTDITAGRLELKLADVNIVPLPLNDEAFDKVFAVNVLYFLADPVATLRELHRVLVPGARIALGVVNGPDLEKMKLTQTGIFRGYEADDVINLLTTAGFKKARAETSIDKMRTMNYITAEK